MVALYIALLKITTVRHMSRVDIYRGLRYYGGGVLPRDIDCVKTCT